MPGYYSTALAGERLRLCYELAPPRVQQYLEAEIKHAASLVAPTDTVLELGCGYGRILRRLTGVGKEAWGIDSSLVSLQYGRTWLHDCPNCHLLCADAAQLPFSNERFDKVFCLQNGVSAFKLDPRQLLAECLRVVKYNGVAVFSSYSESFWADRLSWFHIQSDAGLVGPIDDTRTGNGVIVCTDGFTARTATVEEFQNLAQINGAACRTYEIDGSSLFAEFTR